MTGSGSGSGNTRPGCVFQLYRLTPNYSPPSCPSSRARSRAGL